MGRRCASGGKHRPIPYDVRDDSVTADILRPLSVGRIMTTGKPSFHCPNCNALYEVVKVEAGPETAYRAINWPCLRRPASTFAKASSSSSIFCFAQADAFSVGDDRI